MKTNPNELFVGLKKRNPTYKAGLSFEGAERRTNPVKDGLNSAHYETKMKSDMQKIPEVNLNWSPKKLEKFLDESDSWMLILDENMSPRDLEDLFLKHIKSPYCSDEIISEIAEHQIRRLKSCEL